MGSYSDKDLINQLESYSHVIPQDLIHSLSDYIHKSDEQNKYSKPMPWIGMYIALASLICIFAVVADLLHGLRNRKLWFPCKYFTLDAASLTVIAVATKLPVDLNNPMRGDLDQMAKLGSMAFMCSMMANILPSLSTMDAKELFANMVGLSVLVITLVVNICIEMKTGVVSHYYRGDFTAIYQFKLIATIYVGMLLVLLMIHACSSLAILTSKQMLELKYQEVHETSLKNHQPGILSTVEKLKQYVSKYWIMAETGSPKFMTSSSATTSASGVICALSTILHILLLLASIPISEGAYESDYKWSILVIFIIQFIGGVLGTIAPLCRCFASLRFKLSIKWIWNHMRVFKVESYWTQSLSDLKQTSIPSPFSSRKCKFVIENLKMLILNISIGFQKTVVIACKTIALIPIFFMIGVFYCWRWLKALLSVSGIVLGKNSEQSEQYKDLHRYALQIQDDMQLADRTLNGISKSVERLIQKAGKKQPNNLMNLLAKSRGFEGVGKYDNHDVPPILSEGYVDCWSLPLVTLTTIAISLPYIQNNIVDRLLISVSEGLAYVTLVEESLNGTDEYESTRKAAKFLWLEVEIYQKWHGNRLRKLAPQLNTTVQILQWFKDTAKNMAADVENDDIGFPNDNSICRSVSANSMYRITETILLSYHSNTDEVSQEKLYAQLSSMIADILAACLTNLPRVIMMKCHTSELEKREASVHVAAQLLGETMQIIDSLKDRELPSMNPDELAFIDKWCAYYNHPSP